LKIVRLTVCSEDQTVQEYRLEKEKIYSLGRGAENDIVVSSSSVSRCHATIEYHQGSWRVVDRGSTNGIRFNLQKVAFLSLTATCQFYLGDVSVVYEEIQESSFIAEQSHDQWRSDVCLELSDSLNNENQDASLAKLLSAAVDLTKMQRGMLLVGQDVNALRIKLAVGALANELTVDEFSGSVGAIEQAARTKTAIMSMDTSSHQFFAKRETIQLKQIAALVCIPIIENDELLGVLYTDSQEIGKLLKPIDIDILGRIGGHLATILRSLIIQDRLKEILSALAESSPENIVDIPLSDLNYRESSHG
jgi:GAF domain-containing protein